MKVRCCICDTTGENNWKSLDYLRIRNDIGFVICKTCGFVTYKGLNQDHLRRFYDKGDFNPDQKIAGTKDYYLKLGKLPFHRAFLGQYFMENPGLKIVDIGCSTGYFLKMCRDEYGQDQVWGTEWSPVHSKFGKNAYGLNIRKDIEDHGDQTYDLICMEHVLEHILDPDLFLRKLIDGYLKDNGLFYISVPIWFDILGLPSMIVLFEHGFEGLFTTDHLNIFSFNSLLNLYRKIGLKVVRENYSYYGYRALLQKTGTDPAIVSEDFNLQIDVLVRQKKALEYAVEKKYSQAIDTYEKFPTAIAENARLSFPEPCYERIDYLEKAVEKMPNVETLYWMIGHTYYGLNQFDQALIYYLKAYEVRPATPIILWQIGQVYIKKGDLRAAVEIYENLLWHFPQYQFEPIYPGLPTVLDALGMLYAQL